MVEEAKQSWWSYLLAASQVTLDQDGMPRHFSFSATLFISSSRPWPSTLGAQCLSFYKYVSAKQRQLCSPNLVRHPPHALFSIGTSTAPNHQDHQCYHQIKPPPLPNTPSPTMNHSTSVPSSPSPPTLFAFSCIAAFQLYEAELRRSRRLCAIQG